MSDQMVVRALVILVVLLGVSTHAHAEFSDQVLKSVRSLQEEILLMSRRNINAADAASLWAVFDQDVLRTFNGSLIPLTAATLNQQYGLTDIRIPLKEVGQTGDMKTGFIRIEFFPLKSQTEGKPDWLTIYYHGLGVVPSSTFHIFRYRNKRYVLAAAMEQTRFLDTHPNLLWRAIQLQVKDNPGTLTAYYIPVTRQQNPNRSKVSWRWDGKKLKAHHWVPEVDFHRNHEGTVVSGPGEDFALD